jgi:MSHA pilin protein MshC
MRALGRTKKEPQGSFFYGRGFSLAELIAVILIVSVLGAVAMSRLGGGFATSRGFYDELLSQVQYARKLAIAQRRPVFVRIAGGQSSLCYNGAGACVGVAGPNGATPFQVTAPAGVGVADTVLQFNPAGGLVAAGQATVTVTHPDGNLAFRVEHVTGYVRQ